VLIEIILQTQIDLDYSILQGLFIDLHLDLRKTGRRADLGSLLE
jgi:hypothetical protein